MGFLQALPTASKTGKPKDMLGTKTPSITSMCNQSASLSLIISTSALRFRKSAESKEGAISGFFIICLVKANGITLAIYLYGFITMGNLPDHVKGFF